MNKDIDVSRDSKEKKAKNKEESSTLENIATAYGTSEVVDRYGSAISEDFVAYSGKRVNPNGSITSYQKSHSKIATHKVTTETNKAQHAGFSAEVNYTTQQNKEAILSGKNTRTVRTDDLGRVNDPIVDVVTLDTYGNLIAGTETQIKFTGNPEELCKKIAGMSKEGTKNDLTRYQGTKLLLPTEDVEKAKTFCTKQANALDKQADKIAESNPELAAEKRKQAQELRKVRENIRDSKFSRKQAEAYRASPVKETAKSIGRTANDAGIQGAKFGATIGGTISMATNMYAVYQGNKELGEAVVDTAVATGKSAAVGYSTAFTGSALKGAMEQSYGVLLQKVENKALEQATKEAGKKLSAAAKRKVAEEAKNKFATSTTGKLAQNAGSLSKTNLPTLAVTVCIEYGNLVKQYAQGEIDGVEFMEKAGEKGVGLYASSAMAVVGQVAIPIPVVGAVIGGMIGYTLSSMFYNEALLAFKGAKQAHKDYLIIKARYEEAKRQRDIYQAELQRQFDEHMSTKKQEISFAFQQIDKAIEVGNVDDFALNINSLAEMFNAKLQFNNRAEFDNFMESDKLFVL